jgi:hypothetical protein
MLTDMGESKFIEELENSQLRESTHNQKGKYYGENRGT